MRVCNNLWMGFPKYQTVVIVGFSRRVPQQEHVFVESFFEILQDFIDFYSIYLNKLIHTAIHIVLFFTQWNLNKHVGYTRDWIMTDQFLSNHIHKD